MNDNNLDPELTNILRQLPEAPDHGDGFWDELNTSLSAQQNETNVVPFQPSKTVRYSAFAAAAAAVLFGALIGIGALGGNDQLIDTADDNGSPATTAPTTTTPPTTTTNGAADAGEDGDEEWNILFESNVAEGVYVSRATEQVDCGDKEIAFASSGATLSYGVFAGTPLLVPGPNGALALLTTCEGSYLDLRIGYEANGPVERFDRLALDPEPIALENLSWDVADQVVIATAIFDTEPVQVRIDAETGAVTVVDETVRYLERAASDLFHYDIGIPPQFTVDYATGRGISISDVGQSFNAGLQVSNYLVGDLSYAEIAEPYSEEQATGRRDIIVPLLEENNGQVTDRGVILEITEITFTGGFSENRVVRIYQFNDRTVVAELRFRDGVLSDDPSEILDDIRMFNAAFAPIDGCSSEGLDPLTAPAALNAAQAATYTAISAALSACDWDALEELTANGFVASLGGGDALDIWQSAEEFDEPILSTLYDHLSLEVAIGDEGEAVWPRAHLELPQDITEGMKDDLRSIGYTDEDFTTFEEIGYVGYRTGIAADGSWLYFIAGD